MSEKQTKAQAAEAAAIRRRWITLGEIVAVAALIISGLTFWNSYSERTASEAERAAEKAAAAEAETEAADSSQTLLPRAPVNGRGTSLAPPPTGSGQLNHSPNPTHTP